VPWAGDSLPMQAAPVTGSLSAAHGTQTGEN
jgi:hypothetical protein